MEIKLPKIAPEGHIFIIIFATVSLFLMLLSDALGFIGLILTAWCAYFFRDPQRLTPINDSLVIAPADGRIIKIEKVVPPSELGIANEMLKISIFMNVFNVHINRTPCSGHISKIIYNPGKFFNASLDKASEFNERQSFIMTTKQNDTIAFVQIAGLIAKRIVKFTEEDVNVVAGQKVGLIRFGSRVDLYLPADTIPLCAVGQTTLSGETILANFDYKGEKYEYLTLDRATND
jgi:phosphatidylserine decarboxylase